MVITIGSALVAAVPSIAGLDIGGGSCGGDVATRCTTSFETLVGAPMECRGLRASQGFGDTLWEHPHTGIDIVCPRGTPVTAVTAGVFHRKQGAPIPCSFPPGRSGGLGTYAEIDMGGEAFLYGHLEGFSAVDGEHVAAGQPIGFEGATGCATGPHLHFEIIQNGRPINPCGQLPEGYPGPHDPATNHCWGSAPP
jgi:murein DD-endopeptidase MepM/ murein hydrolase activator NlpD